MGFGKYFGKLAVLCYKYKCMALGFCLSVTAIMGLGMINVKFETDPQNLWVSHSDRTYKEQ